MLQNLLRQIDDFENTANDLTFEEYSNQLSILWKNTFDYLFNKYNLKDLGYVYDEKLSSIKNKSLNLAINFFSTFIEVERYDEYKTFYNYGIKENLSIKDIEDFFGSLKDLQNKLEYNLENLNMFKDFSITKYI